jgi:ketosteroid isomerase-like protein
MADAITPQALQAFADAWNRHDVEAIMSFMTEDCVFESSAGPEVCGTRYVRVEVHGCDLFTCRNGKIALKNSYRKNRPPLSAR